jgi:surface protein
MFLNCHSLRKLDVSSFNTRNASKSWTDEWNSQKGDMASMFNNTYRLEKITFGENFSFTGDGTCTAAVIPTPNATYITDADGNWYDADGNAYAPSDVPNVAGTYYASLNSIDVEYLIKRPTLKNIAKAIRSKNGSSSTYTPNQMATAIEDISAGVELPELSNPAEAAEVFEDKEYIDATGAKKTGTFTITPELSILDTLLTTLETSLEGKAGGGHSFVEEKDVNFYDYDGTLLYSYTLDEVQELTELPPAPDWHDELVFYEWNWSLENIKAENCQIDVGALYDTNDSKAHLHITIDEYVSKVVSITVTGTGYIDWGDGSAIENVSASASTVYSHEYPSTGNYIIKVWSDGYIYLGYTSGSTNMFGATTNYGLQTTLLRKAFIGTKCRLNRYVFANCTQLEYLTVSPINGISYGMCQGAYNLICCHLTKSGNTNNYYTFYDCFSLRNVTLSDSVQYISSGQFRSCRSLKRIRGKKNVTFSEGYAFYTCMTLTEARGIMNKGNTAIFFQNYSLRKFKFDDASTGIPNQAFDYCFVLQSLDIPASVTTIGSQAFRGV